MKPCTPSLAGFGQNPILFFFPLYYRVLIPKYNSGMNTHEKISNHLAAVNEAMLLLDHEAIEEVVRYLQDVKKVYGSVWLIGNGGSAATASHFANDLRKMAGFSAIAISDQVPMITAYGNDDGWLFMYSHALRGFMEGNDCLIAISCSGRSQNILEAAKMVEKEQLIVLTGESKNNPLAKIPSSGLVYVSSPDIKVQEDVHLAICHAIAGAL